MYQKNTKIWAILLSILHISVHAGEWIEVTSRTAKRKEQHAVQQIYDQTLHAYKQSKLYTAVNRFLSSGKSPNAHNKEGQTLMHIAAKKNHPAAIELLHANGGIVDVADKCGITPLHWAAGKGSEDAVEKLLALGAGMCISYQDRLGRTPIHRGAGVSTDVIYQLMNDRYMTNQDTKSKVVNLPDANGMTALHWAASGGKIGALKILLNNNAKVDAQDYLKGRTALHWILRMRVGAVYKGGRQISGRLAYDMLEWVLEYGASPCIPDNTGMTPIDWAQAMNWQAEAQLLMDNLPENMN